MGIIKRTFRTARKNIKKRYTTKQTTGKFKGKRTLNIAQMAQDVANLAQMINAEKKILSIGSANQLAVGKEIGQVNQNVSGAQAYDLTPLMPQGSGVSDRTGNSIKLHSSYFQFQAQGQANTNTAIRIRIEMWVNPGKTQDQSTIMNDLYVNNPFTGIIDYNSARNPDHFNNYRCILKRVIYLPVDQITGQTSNKQIAVPFKWNKGKGHHIRYTGTGSTNYLTDVQAGQIFLLYFADNGNTNAVASTLPGIPVAGAQTAGYIRMSYRHYFYDN